ncbi:MAG: HD domain-containing protein [Coxiellaceae bacterium]|nr:HD domain-containing protein [Coxiellaceae bacterium]
MTNRLTQQLNFLKEIDALKTIFRHSNLIADKDRFENSAEHSWHLALYVMVLHEYANARINITRVLKMVLIHDIVEVDAGDTYCYDTEGLKDKAEREQKAADRLFGLLPSDQAQEFRSLWDEFEASETMDAKFAQTIDRMQPMLHNYTTGGGSWLRHNIAKKTVMARMNRLMEGSTVIAEFVQTLIDDAVAKKMLSV